MFLACFGFYFELFRLLGVQGCWVVWAFALCLFVLFCRCFALDLVFEISFVAVLLSFLVYA